MIVYDTDNYRVEVGKSSDVDFRFDLYCIVNKETNVVEMESRLLPQAKIYCEQLNMAAKEPNEANIPKIEYTH